MFDLISITQNPAFQDAIAQYDYAVQVLAEDSLRDGAVFLAQEQACNQAFDALAAIIDSHCANQVAEALQRDTTVNAELSAHITAIEQAEQTGDMIRTQEAIRSFQAFFKKLREEATQPRPIRNQRHRLKAKHMHTKARRVSK